MPLAAALIPPLGWRETYSLLGVVVAGIGVPVLLWLARDPPALSVATHPTAPRLRPGLDVWLVGAGYFGCGWWIPAAPSADSSLART